MSTSPSPNSRPGGDQRVGQIGEHAGARFVELLERLGVFFAAQICSTARIRRAGWLLGCLLDQLLRRSRARPPTSPGGGAQDQRALQQEDVFRDRTSAPSGRSARRSARPSRRPRCAPRDRCRQGCSDPRLPRTVWHRGSAGAAKRIGSKRQSRQPKACARSAARIASSSPDPRWRPWDTPLSRRGAMARPAREFRGVRSSRQCARAMQNATACRSAALNGSSGSGASASCAIAP